MLDHDDQADDVVAAEELCRFFGLAPDCYEEFRLLTNPGQPMLELTAAYLLARSDTRNMIDYPGVDLEELAADMQWYASAHGLSVSLSNDETYSRSPRRQRSQRQPRSCSTCVRVRLHLMPLEASHMPYLGTTTSSVQFPRIRQLHSRSDQRTCPVLPVSMQPMPCDGDGGATQLLHAHTLDLYLDTEIFACE